MPAACSAFTMVLNSVHLLARSPEAEYALCGARKPIVVAPVVAQASSSEDSLLGT